MFNMSRKAKKILAALLMALATILLGFGLKLSPLLETSQKNLSNYFYDEREIGDEIVVVAIDEKSISEPESGGLGSFGNWDNITYAGVIENIESAKPSVLYLDILFSSNSQSISLPSLINYLKTKRRRKN